MPILTFLIGAVVLTAFGAMAVLAVAIHFDNKRRNNAR